MDGRKGEAYRGPFYKGPFVIVLTAVSKTPEGK